MEVDTRNGFHDPAEGYARMASTSSSARGADGHDGASGEGGRPGGSDSGVKDVRLYCDYSLGVFGSDNALRRMCIRCVESQLFEALVIFVILLNCPFLALVEPMKGDREGRNKLVYDSEIYFTVIFLIELLIKTIAMGFFWETSTEVPDQKYFAFSDASVQSLFPANVKYTYVPTYLRDGWNVLDFVVVVGGIVSLSGVESGVSSIRTIRVLRPLRTITALPGMRILVGTMIKSLPMMANVLLLSVFLFVVFGILGVQLFKGVLRNRCFALDAVTGNATIVVDETRPCSPSDKLLWPGHVCGTDEACLPYANPNFGITSFDNIFWAWLTIFQCVTLEGWTPIMYNTMDATTGYSLIYFILMIGLGAFFLVNLAVGIVTEVYDGVNEADIHDQKQIAKDGNMGDGAQSATNPSGSGSNPGSPSGLSPGRLSSLLQWVEDSGDNSAGWLRRSCKVIIEDPLFDPFFTAVIFTNMIVLSMEYHKMPTKYADNLDLANEIFAYLFGAEMILKIGGKRKEYFSDRSDLFDMVVTISSFVEMALGDGGSLTALRAFRILRVLRLFRRWKSLQDFLQILVETISGLGNFTFIVVLVVFIYALLGMEFFGNKFNFSDGKPRHNFDTLLYSIISVFQILTGEDWNVIMYDGIRATDETSSFYFISLILIGQYVVLNLFIAILLSNFGDQHKKDEEEEKKKVERQKRKQSFNRRAQTQRKKSIVESMIPKSIVSMFAAPEEDGKGARSPGVQRIPSASIFEQFVNSTDILNEDDYATRMDEMTSEEKEVFHKFQMLKKQTPKRNWMPSFPGSNKSEGGSNMGGYGGTGESSIFHPRRSCFFLHIDHPFRRLLLKIIENAMFEYMILFLIFASSVSMAWETPRQSTLADETFYKLDVAFLSAFCLEAAMKILAFGFLFGKGSYLHDSWNVLDFIIVVAGLLGVALKGYNVDWIRNIRIIRSFRPLRFVSRVPELKVVVRALMKSIPALWNVIVVSLILWMICGILSMQLFMGRFHYCDSDVCCNTLTSSNGTEVACETVRLRSDCVGIAGSIDSGVSCSWLNERMNFDNLYNSLLTLFEMSTTEGWTVVMYAAMDSVGIDKQRRRDHQPAVALYFIVLMIFLSFFILNLFVGIILDTFSEMQRRNNYQSNFLTDAQQQWVDSQKIALTSTPKSKVVHGATVKMKALNFVQSTAFDTFIMSCILVNVIFMTFEHQDQGDGISNMLQVANYVFSSIFATEAVLKICVFTMNKQNYFADRWNRFDFVVVCISLYGIFSGSGGGGAAALRIFRIGRIFRLVKVLKGLNILFKTLVISIPTIVNVGGLMFIVFFIFAVLGVKLFGKVDMTAADDYGHYANFQSFGYAMLTLFRMSTGEAWNSIMEEAAIRPPDCEAASEPYCKNLATGAVVLGLNATTCIGSDRSWVTVLDNCGSNFAILYFVAFVIFGSFIFLNLVIAVVLENFSLTLRSSKNIGPQEIEEFQEAWSKIDPLAKGFIKTVDLERLAQSLSPPLGLKSPRLQHAEILRFKQELQLPNTPFQEYYDVLIAVIIRSINNAEEKGGPAEDSVIPEEIKVLMDLKRKSMQKKVSNYEGTNAIKVPEGYSDDFNDAETDEFFAALVIQRYFREWLRSARRQGTRLAAA